MNVIGGLSLIFAKNKGGGAATAYDPPLVLMEDAVMPLADREVEEEGVHEPTMRIPAIGRWDSDLVWPAAINRGG